VKNILPVTECNCIKFQNLQKTEKDFITTRLKRGLVNLIGECVYLLPARRGVRAPRARRVGETARRNRLQSLRGVSARVSDRRFAGSVRQNEHCECVDAESRAAFGLLRLFL
jgi:hypothetical protein